MPNMSQMKFILPENWNQVLLAIFCVYSKLDYDFLADHKYEFKVMAADGGSPPLTGSATVQVITECCIHF